MNPSRAFPLRLMLASLLCLSAACSETPTEPPAPAWPEDQPTCDPLQPDDCAFPWPSSVYMKPDETTATGHRLQFAPTTLPKNAGGVHVDPTALHAFDGYGVGSAALVHFPHLDPSNLPDENHISESLAEDAAIVWLEIVDGEIRRIPWWAELDSNESDPAQQALYIHPAVILREGAREVIGIRNLQDTAGESIPPSAAFLALRDGGAEDDDELSWRVPRFEEVFELLGDAGMSRSELVLAWDFVTASSESLHGDLLAIRAAGFAATGPEGPELTIAEVIEFTEEEDADIAIEITGTFRVPSFMEPWSVEGKDSTILHRDADGNVAQNGWRDAPMWIRIPRAALDGTPQGLMLYAHGLNGSGSQVRAGHNSRVANTQNMIYFGCDLIGMSDADVEAIVAMITNMSHFRIIPERVHQGMLEHLLLTRAMRERFADLETITSRGIQVNTDELFFSGISQGGIYGGTVMALSQDITRGHLGVPGQNYSLLLHRSVNFTPFFEVLKAFYPYTRDQAVILQACQTLWDRVDSSSHYRHIEVDPFPDTPPHQVLLASATGDYQVALVTNEITVRSDVGVALLPDYGKAVDGVDVSPYPHMGSGLVNYDFGNPWPEPGNQPPLDLGEDPHGLARQMDHHTEQMMHFLRHGEIIDVCGGDGCTPE